MMAELSRNDSMVVEFINNITLTEQRPIAYPPLNTTSPRPEELALQWLIVNDTLKLLPDSPDGRFRLKQRYALLTLWFQQTSTNTTWLSKANWLTAADECSWAGIRTCNGQIQNAVTYILMSNNNMKGVIPADLGLLTSLEYADFRINAFTGTLPASIGNWTSIKAAAFNGNGFTGSMPNGICTLRTTNPSFMTLLADCNPPIEVTCPCCTQCF
jgi:hypothetical protein